MWPPSWAMGPPHSPSRAGGVQSTAAGGSAATSRSVRRRTLSKKLKYDAMSVIMARSFAMTQSCRWPEHVVQQERLHVDGPHRAAGNESGLARDQHRTGLGGLGAPGV